MAGLKKLGWQGRLACLVPRGLYRSSRRGRCAGAPSVHPPERPADKAPDEQHEEDDARQHEGDNKAMAAAAARWRAGALYVRSAAPACPLPRAGGGHEPLRHPALHTKGAAAHAGRASSTDQCPRPWFSRGANLGIPLPTLQADQSASLTGRASRKGFVARVRTSEKHSQAR